MSDRFEAWGRIAGLIGLLLLLLGSSFFYGSTQAWATEWVRFGAILLVAIAAWTVTPAQLLARPAGRLVLPLAAFLAWGTIQTLPIPRAVLGAVSPKAAELYRLAAPEGGGAALPQWLLDRALSTGIQVGDDRALPEATDDPGDRAAGRSISLHPGDTRDAVLAWTTPILLFLAAVWVAWDPTDRYRLLWGVTALAGIWGTSSILQQLGWKGSPLWDHDWTGGVERPVLPFVNRNHYAGFVTMALLAGIGLFLAILTRSTGKLNVRALREALSDGAWAAPRLLGTGLAVALGFIGVVLSGSRGGLLALAGGLVFFALARTLRSWLALAVVAIVLVGLLAGVPSLTKSATGEFEQAPFVSNASDSSGLLRMDVWTKTMRMFLDFPLTGTGLGTFPWGFSMYQRQGEWMIFREAHNDYLQVLSETGLVGIVLLGWALFAFLWWILRPALGGGGRRPRYTTIGAAAGMFAIFVHSLLDFNLQIPSNAALFAVLLGIVTAAARDTEPAAGGSA